MNKSILQELTAITIGLKALYAISQSLGYLGEEMYPTYCLNRTLPL